MLFKPRSRSRRCARLALTLALAGGPVLASAQAGPGYTPAGAAVPEPLSWFDIYGTSIRLDGDNTNSTEGEDSRIGAGAAAHLTFGRLPQPARFFLDGSLQRNQFDTSNVDLDQYRVGAGVEFGLPNVRLSATSPRLFAKAEFTDWRLDFKSGNSNGSNFVGGGAHVGIRKPFAGIASVYAQAGYIRLEGRDNGAYIAGPEITGGIDLVPTPDLSQNARLFAEYRYSGARLHGGGATTDLNLGDIRVGVRIGFGDYRQP